MAANDVIKRLLDAGIEFTSMTRSKAEALVNEWVREGEVRVDDAQQAVQQLMDRGRESTDRLVQLVRDEVRRQLDQLGLVRGNVERDADEAVASATKAAKTASSGAKQAAKRATKAAGEPAAPATQAQKAVPGKAAATKKAAPKKAAAKATPAKATPAKATPAKAAPKKAAKSSAKAPAKKAAAKTTKAR